MKEFIKNKKWIFWAVTIVAALILASVIGRTIYDATHSLDCKITRTDNGSVQLEASVADFREKDMEFGDSLSFVFSTAYNAEEVALLNGNYMNSGMHIAIAKDENSPIVFQFQSASGVWEKANLNESSTVHVGLTNKGKYKDLYKAFNMPLNGDLKNVRSLRGGNLKLLDLFRGTNPSINAEVSDTMHYYYQKMGIVSKLNLDDNKYGIRDVDIKSKESNSMIIEKLFSISANPGRTFIYSANDDCTAYFSAIIEALAGAKYDEIVGDYMETYKTLYGITLEDYPAEYNAIKTYHIDWFLHKFSKTPNSNDMKAIDFAYVAEMYLRSNGVSNDDINKIVKRLCA